MLPFDINSGSKDNQKKKLQQLYRYLFIGIIILVFVSYSLHNSLRFFVINTPNNNEYHAAMEKHKFIELIQQRNGNLNRISSINHLIIIPGHSAVHINKISSAAVNDNAWYLLPYQTNQQFSKIIMSHINKGLELLEWDESSLLVFSGGQTRNDVGPISEAASYYYVARETLRQTQSMMNPDIISRMVLEEYARDSYENLLFSICRFYEMTNNYPVKITIVGFDFKKDRFMKIHRAALRFPVSAFNYIGIHVSTPGFNYENALKGEKSVLSAFSKDFYGCGSNDMELEQSADSGSGNEANGDGNNLTINPIHSGSGATALYSKKQSRNPFRRSIPYSLSNPALASLINICRDMTHSDTDATILSSSSREKRKLGEIYDGLLPW